MTKEQPKTSEQFMALPIVELSREYLRAIFVADDTIFTCSDEDGRRWRLVQNARGEFARVMKM